MAQIVLNTFGSFGDLHPFLALALELKRRGHDAVLATSEVYRDKISAEGIPFRPVRPDVGELIDRQDLIDKLWDVRLGTQFLIRDYLAPRVEESFEDLRAACEGADLLLTHSAAYGGPIAGELLQIPWLSVALQPAVFFSAYDPLVIPEAPWLRYLYPLGPSVFRSLMKIADYKLRPWVRPIVNLRAKLGLRTLAVNPITLGQFSPYGTLALFSRAFAEPQTDWPRNTMQAGFVFYDKLGDIGRLQRNQFTYRDGQSIESFLKSGEPPILFTLGSSAVMRAGAFFSESLAAAQMLGRRAVLLIGESNQQSLPTDLPPSVYVTSYLPFSEIMPRVAAIVHQGGIGTTAQSLRAGRPILVVPWAHDQPDNAERLRRIGVARWMSKKRYRARRVAKELQCLLTNRTYELKAKQASEFIARQNGAVRACDALDELLRSGAPIASS